MPIYSSPEQVGLVLSKLMTESAKVVVISILLGDGDKTNLDSWRSASSVEGHITGLDQPNCIVVIADEYGRNNVSIKYAEFNFTYGNEAERQIERISSMNG